MINKVLTIIPTYNEKDNIEKLLNKIFELYKDTDLEVLVVDDNSPDGTANIVKNYPLFNERVFILEREKKEGLGKAYIAGFKWALERDYDVVVQMDADFSHDPIYIKDLLNAIENYDLVIGSRYIEGVSVVHWPMTRLLLSYAASIYTRLVTSMPIKDPTGGFKAIRREVLKSINLDDISATGYSFQIEVNYRTWKKGFRIKEIPIIFVDRVEGTSKMNSKIITEALYIIWKLRILSLFKKI